MGALVLAALAASPAPQTPPAHDIRLAQDGYPQPADPSQGGYQPAPAQQNAPPPYDQSQGAPGPYDQYPDAQSPPPYGQPPGDTQQSDPSQGAYQSGSDQTGADQAGDGSSGDYGVDSVGQHGPRKKRTLADEPQQQAIPPFNGHTQEELDEYYAKYGAQLEQFEDRYGPQPSCAMPAEPGKAAPDMSSVPCLNYGQERQARERMKAGMIFEAGNEMNRCTQDCTVRAHYCKDVTRPGGTLLGIAPDCRGPYERCTAACRQDYDERTRLVR